MSSFRRRSFWLLVSAAGLMIGGSAACAQAVGVRTAADPASQNSVALDAGAAVTLMLDEPETVKQPAEHRISVLNDGLAHVHLKPSMTGGANSSVDLYLSTFKADGQPVTVVGFEGEQPGDGPRLAYRQNVKVAAAGTDIKLSAPGLAPGIDYVGNLYATIGNHKTIIWQITLMRPLVVPSFECPVDTQRVESDGTTAIIFKRLAPLTQQPVGLRLSAFISKEQELADVGFTGKDPNGPLQRELPDYKLARNELIPPIRTEGIEEGATYVGRIAFFAGNTPLGECPLSLQMPRRSVLELLSDAPSLSRSITLPVFGAAADESLSLRLFGKLRSRRLDGISATLDGPTESPAGSFNVTRHVAFWINGAEVKNFMDPSSGSPAGRLAAPWIPRNGQMNVELRFRDLDIGRYTFALRFYGNDTASPGPKVDVTVNVRQHWIYALFAILVAVAVSMFISKGVVNWRKRILIRNQLAQLDQSRFEQYAALPSVVFLRVVIAQTQKLLGKIWIFPIPDSAYDYVARAQRVCSILTRYAAVKEALQDSGCGESVKYHFNEEIKDVMHRIGPQALDQKTTDGILADLTAIAAHLNDPMTWYWSILKSKAAVLVEQAQEIRDDLGGSDVVRDLLARLDDFPATVTPDIDHAYWLLKLLVSRRQYPDDITRLIDTYAATHNLAKTLSVADQLAWDRLTAAVDKGQVRIDLVDPTAAPTALSPIKLILKFDDRAVADSYLVNNVVTYEWHFTQTDEKGQSRGPPWSEALGGPRVTQYVTFPGQLEVKVFIRRHMNQGDLTKELNSYGVKIQTNRDLSFWRSLFTSMTGSEVLVTLIVTAVAILTALPALYFSKPTFGSFGDYVAILAWAIGVDQGKNLIQLLKTYPTDPATGTQG